ncbi:hypothetical protein ACFYVR_18780 [Rhodococcus sp. NPDC003318]|uniref:hypothetical protein n=1 Tax=Rhodococcus sp. NPDC003318 TaxID=3364503 RepID=UPI0036CC846A
MSSPKKRVLFVGSPGTDEVAQWAALRELATQRGFECTRTPTAGGVRYVVATAEVLGGSRSPAQERILHEIDATGLRYLSVHAAYGWMSDDSSPGERP